MDVQLNVVGQSASAVLLAQFPHEKYSFKNLYEYGVFQDEPIQSLLNSLKTTDSELSISFDTISLNITSERLQISGPIEKGPQMSLFLNKLFSIQMPENIKALGLNGEFVCRLSRHDYNEVCNKLFPVSELQQAMDLSLETEIHFHDNRGYPLRNVNVKLIELNENSADIHFSYNMHHDLKSGDEGKLLELVMQISEYWNKYLASFAPLTVVSHE